MLDIAPTIPSTCSACLIPDDMDGRRPETRSLTSPPSPRQPAQAEPVAVAVAEAPIASGYTEEEDAEIPAATGRPRVSVEHRVREEWDAAMRSRRIRADENKLRLIRFSEEKRTHPQMTRRLTQMNQLIKYFWLLFYLICVNLCHLDGSSSLVF